MPAPPRDDADRVMCRRASLRHGKGGDSRGCFLASGVKGTRAKMALSVLAYNILRVTNIVALSPD